MSLRVDIVRNFLQSISCLQSPHGWKLRMESLRRLRKRSISLILCHSRIFGRSLQIPDFDQGATFFYDRYACISADTSKITQAFMDSSKGVRFCRWSHQRNSRGLLQARIRRLGGGRLYDAGSCIDGRFDERLELVWLHREERYLPVFLHTGKIRGFAILVVRSRVCCRICWFRL